ncbi:energy transducer TonB [Ralstonia pseudosolanacearum]|uniref:energy transducer TonB n=1 Tax=Ralstonia pseudosolanacearum TaxID=1310165 RepID=UPI001FF735F5|nr:energy transducer TonB [Ralstonia pseudosolanacearum]
MSSSGANLRSLFSVLAVGLAFSLNAYGKPREVDVRETRTQCREPTVYYPVQAQKAHAEGRAVVDTVVDTDGSVSEAKLTELSGSAVLDDAAVKAAWTIKCTPFRDPASGTVTTVHFLKPFVFKLMD